MPRIAHYATPQLWGTLDHARPGRLQPDGDTIHVRNPVIAMMGKLIKPEAGKLEVAMPGRKPVVLELRGDPPDYLPIRLSGLDAPERHYVASTRPDPTIPAYVPREGRHTTVCQPHHEPSLAYILRVARRWPRVVVELDREVIDKRERVLGFLYASDEHAERRTCGSRSSSCGRGWRFRSCSSLRRTTGRASWQPAPARGGSGSARGGTTLMRRSRMRRARGASLMRGRAASCRRGR